MTSKPLIVFVGAGMDGLEQTAARIRRFGVETAWVGYPYEPRRVLRARLFCDHAMSARDLDGLVAVLRELGPGRMVDVIGPEDVISRVAAVAPALGLPATLVDDLALRARCSDKFFVAETLRAAGVRVPDSVAADDVSPEQAAERLGLPLVVKGRRGFAGRAVRIAERVEDVAPMTAELASFDGVYYEAMVEGRVQDWSGACLPGGEVIVEGCYRSVRRADNELGAPDQAEVADLPQICEAGHRLVRALELRGLVNVDFMVDAEGREHAIDVNIRPWHSAVAFLDVGVDFTKAYLATLGLAERPAASPSLPDGQRLDIYPRTEADTILDRPLGALGALAVATPRYARRTGVGYVVASAFRTIGIVGANAVARLRARLAG